MAKAQSIAPKKLNSKTVKRKGIVSKKKTSSNKSSTNYKKVYKGQGR